MSSPPGQVLVVDDDEDIRSMVAMILEASGYRTLAAGDGAEALEHLRTQDDVRLVLLDIMMPRMAAPEFMRVLRRNPATAHLPVVILSGDTSVKEHALAMRADHWLIKPIGVADLLSVIGRFASRPPAQTC